MFTITGLENVGNGVFAIVRLVQTLKSNGCSMSIAVAALTLDIIGHFIVRSGFLHLFDSVSLAVRALVLHRPVRLAALVLRFLRIPSSDIRRIEPRNYSQVMQTLGLPFLFAADLLVVLFWIVVLSRKLESVSSFRRLRIPFFVIGTYIIIAEVATDTARAFTANQYISLISVINIILVLALIAVVIFILLYRIRVVTIEGLVFNPRLLRMNKLMIAAACFSVLSVILLSALSAPSLTSNPWFYVSWLFVVAWPISALQFTQLLMFQPGGRGSSRSSSSGNKSGGSGPSASRPKNSEDGQITTKESQKSQKESADSSALAGSS